MNRRWLPWLLIGVMALLFAPLCRPLAREVVLIPLLYLLWLLKFLFDAVPQTVLWPAFVLLLFLILAAGLTGGYRQRPRAAAPPGRPPQRVAEWAQLIEQAGRDDYFKWRLGQQLQKLALRLLAHNRQQSVAEARQALRHKSGDLPPEVLAYFRASLQPLGYLPTARRWQLRRQAGSSPLDVEPARLVAALEQLSDGERESL
ncbi:MAG: hypothetical protein Kow0031_04940 [Anaerolineae bacterium]